MKTSLGHLPALDGLRGIAVALVLGLHSWSSVWPYQPLPVKGGALGVHLFFVLSGFLITTLLLTEHERRGRIDMGGFFVRRLRRLVPALVALLVVVMIVALTGSRLSGRHVVASGFHVLSFATNIWTIGDAPGIAQIVDRLGLPVPEVGHTWSLSIELQFYVLWGLALWAATRARWSSARLASLCVALISLVAVLRIVRMLVGPEEIWFTLYYTSAGRMDAPLIGSLVGIAFCAGWLDRITPRTAAWVGTIGLVLFVMAGFTFEARTPALYYGLYTLLALCGAAVIVGVLRAPRAPTNALLAWRPLRFLGTISYSVYVWHYGMFLFVQREEWGLSGRRWDVPSPVVMVAAISAALAVGTASYWLVERPFLHRRRPKEVVARDEVTVEPAAARTAPVPP